MDLVKFLVNPKKFLWAIIVLNELLGDLIPENVRRYLPHTLAQEGLNKVFFSSSEDEEWNVEDDADDINAGAAAGGGESKSSSSPVVAALEARIAQLEAGGASSGINFWNDSVWQTVFSLIALGAVGHFFNDSVAFGFNHMADLPNMFHGAFPLCQFRSKPENSPFRTLASQYSCLISDNQWCKGKKHRILGTEHH